MRFTVAAAALATGALATQDVSTAYTTNLVTVTQCAETVTDCPARSTTVSTQSVPVTTSTVYSSVVHTNTEGHSVVYSTETIAVSTTVCPVTEQPSGSVPTGTGSVPVAPVPTPSKGQSSNTPVQSTPVPVVPGVSSSVPVAPVPTPSKGQSTNSPVQSTPVPVVPGVPSSAPGAPAPTPSVCVPSKSTTAITKSYTTVLTSVEYQTIDVPCTTGGNSPHEPQPSASFTAVPSKPVGGNSTTTPQPPVPTAGAANIAGSALFAAVAGVIAFALA